MPSKNMIPLGVFLLIGFARISWAQQLTVTEQNPYQTINHLAGFGTTLNATATGQPTPHNEATIVSGPTWRWSVLSQPYQYTNTPPGSQMPTGPTASISGAPPPTRGWPGGLNHISVTVTATWTDDNGVPYPFAKTYDVTFFSLVPSVITIDRHSTQRMQPSNGGGWGHATVYWLHLADNEGDPYTNGFVRETLSKSSLSLNPTYAADLEAQGAPGGNDNSITTLPNGDQQSSHTLQQDDSDPLLHKGSFTDNNSWNTIGWTSPPNQNTGWTTTWFTVNQHLDSVEEWSYGPSIISLKDYTLVYQQEDTLRF